MNLRLPIDEVTLRREPLSILSVRESVLKITGLQKGTPTASALVCR
jgi:hypothetical protein